MKRYLTARLASLINDEPPWLRWLVLNAPTVHERNRNARRVFFHYQVPLVGAIALLHLILKNTGWLGSHHPVTFWLALMALLAFVWPVHIARASIEALRVARTGSLYSRQLRIYGLLSGVAVAAISVLFLCLVAFAVLGTWLSSGPFPR